MSGMQQVSTSTQTFCTRTTKAFYRLKETKESYRQRFLRLIQFQNFYILLRNKKRDYSLNFSFEIIGKDKRSNSIFLKVSQ